MTDDALFQRIEAWHADRPWGRVLDAGTGQHSLDWIRCVQTEGWWAVTADEGFRRDLERRTAPRRLNERVVLGNWQDPGFLAGERFDVVVADYLLGAVDGFAPYFQDRLFERLRPHVGGRLYAVGLEPYPHPEDEGGQLVWEIARLRDACILLAGHRCYREYPLDWVDRHLQRAGYRVVDAVLVPILYRERFVNGQLDVCLRKLPLIDPGLREPLRVRVEELRARGLALLARGPVRFGADWVVAAEPA